ncbi:MAG: HAD-IA family hydrolase, partial [SAR202 cluster bacterium]|nr:HAD-IA family hydrolase [SAR202 cluster bacterium]
MTIRALIFDFDGTIVDTETPGFLSWRATFLKHGLTLTEKQFEGWVGTSADMAWFNPKNVLRAHLNDEPAVQAIDEAREREDLAVIRTQPVMPGVVEYLVHGRARGLKLAVASSSSWKWVSEHMGRVGLVDRFDLIKCGDQVAKRKPAPDLYLAALEGMGIAAHEAVAFEDSTNGISAAKAAGIFTV